MEISEIFNKPDRPPINSPVKYNKKEGIIFDGHGVTLVMLTTNQYGFKEYGNFIADAINEKLKPKTTKVIETVVQISQYLQASKFILQCCNTPDFKGYNYCPICGAKIVRGG